MKTLACFSKRISFGGDGGKRDPSAHAALLGRSNPAKKAGFLDIQDAYAYISYLISYCVQLLFD
jgi:hypothetical protein